MKSFLKFVMFLILFSFSVSLLASFQHPSSMKLWKKVNIKDYKGSYLCLGDLDNDKQVDFLLYRQGPMSTPGYLIAVNSKGKTMWELGDKSIKKHARDGAGNEPALRGILLVYDINQDGKSEVIAELWKENNPWLCIIDGETGEILHERLSPFDKRVRSGKRSRCHPVGMIAYLNGRNSPPSIIIKYSASNNVPCYVAALNTNLDIIWMRRLSKHAAGHIPTVADPDRDGKDEILIGAMLIDDNGNPLWMKEITKHADCTAIFDVNPENFGDELFMSICGTGPAYCMSVNGKTLWEKTKKEVPHGQGIWIGNFINERKGYEAIILCSGHIGDFLTVDAKTGVTITNFKQKRKYEAYPDFPCIVNWISTDIQSLWIPIDRALVDGYGNIVADTGEYEKLIKNRLHWGESKEKLAVQIFAVDLCGDERDEIVMYQPRDGEGILIFTQSDSDMAKKNYIHKKNIYNIRTYY
jgi:hypothetical protein